MPGSIGGGKGGLGGGKSTPTTTDSGVCAISPSDLVGYTGNALNRLKELEQRVAELEAKNTEVNQLSDLSQQVGWVGNVTYMGQPGWTQTEYGTLIPPPGVSLSSLGFLMSDGNTYPFVVMDENGVLQYGFTATGGIGGASVGKVKVARLGQTVSTTYTAISPHTKLTLDYVAENNDSIVSLASNAVTFAFAGLYAISWAIFNDYPAGAGTNKRGIFYMGTAAGLVTHGRDYREMSGAGQFTGGHSGIFRMTAGETLSLFATDTGTAGATRTLDIVNLDIAYFGP